VIRLDPVIPAEVVTNRLKSFDRVTRLRVTLRIPNPDLGPSFKRLYDEMVQGDVRELSEDMRNERGLKLEPNTLPQAALDMAIQGYRKGRIHVYGYRDREKADFTITDEIARVEIEGYAAGQRSPAVKRFAETIMQRIEENIRR
jgi:hypothetical protein